MEHSPSWIANCLTIQEIYFSLRNQKFHCRVQKSPRLVSILNQINPACTLPLYFFKIYFNIILSSILRYWSGLLLQVSPSKPCKHFLSSRMHAIHPARLIILDVLTLIFSVGYKSWSYSLCYLLQRPVISSLLVPSVLHRALLTKSLAHTFFSLLWKTSFHTHTV